MPLKKVYVFPGGMGDAIMALAVAHNYYLQHGEPMHIGHKCNELFDNNHEVVCHPEYAFWKLGETIIKQSPEERGFELISLYYFAWRRIASSYWSYFNGHENLVSQLCKQAGLSGEIVVNPYFILSDIEIDYGLFATGKIAVISNGVATYKSWSLQAMQKVINAFPHECFIQLGFPTDPPFINVEDGRGKYTIRQIASILRHCRLFLGPIGGMMHLARSVNCPAFILLPSFETPEWYYREFDYLSPLNRCLECENNQSNPDTCSHQKRCMDISIDQVIDSLKRTLEKPRKVLKSEKSVVEASPAEGLVFYKRMISSFNHKVQICLCNSDCKVEFERRELQLDNKEYVLEFRLSEIQNVEIFISRNLHWFYEIKELSCDIAGISSPVNYRLSDVVVHSHHARKLFMPWRRMARISLDYGQKSGIEKIRLCFASMSVERLISQDIMWAIIWKYCLCLLPRITYKLEHVVDIYRQEGFLKTAVRCFSTILK